MKMIVVQTDADDGADCDEKLVMWTDADDDDDNDEVDNDGIFSGKTTMYRCCCCY